MMVLEFLFWRLMVVLEQVVLVPARVHCLVVEEAVVDQVLVAVGQLRVVVEVRQICWYHVLLQVNLVRCVSYDSVVCKP